MNLEERVERLETFIGDIDKIISVYANSVQEICDKYLNILYIEEYDSDHPNYLNVTGFLSDLTTISALPKNVVFNVRPSHTFAYDGDDHSSKIRLRRLDTETNTEVILDVPLKKYDLENPGNLVFLEPGDYIQGMLYGIYINAQGIAVISSNDAGTLAYESVTQLSDTVSGLSDAITALANEQTIADATITTASITNLTVSEALTLTQSIVLPTGSTCSTPSANDNSTKIANTAYVDNQVAAAIEAYRNAYHLFGTSDPSLNDAPEGAIYYKYNG